MLSATNRFCCSVESGAASYRVDPGVSLITRSVAASRPVDAVIIILGGQFAPHTNDVIGRLNVQSGPPVYSLSAVTIS